VSGPPLQIAIVGSGPAGAYAAELLAREAPGTSNGGARIDVIDRLPTPFGLVRAGVAADHQNTKAIQRVLERALTRPGIEFWGNVEIGREVSLSELRTLYDAVVIATGTALDRPLSIPGATLPGVIGSRAFAYWLNAHPDAPELGPLMKEARHIVIIGHGNVAIDMARMLAKRGDELARSDLDPAIEAVLAAAPMASIDLVGRRGPGDAQFTPVELAELGTLAAAHPLVRPQDLDLDASPANSAILEILKGFASLPPDSRPLPLRFHFNAPPLAIEGVRRVARVRFAGLDRPADLVISCIGYVGHPLDDLAPIGGSFPNEEGRIAPGLYVVGWAKRGPSGTIATNRADSHQVARRLLAEVTPAGREGGEGLARCLAARGGRRIDWAAWRRIDAAETARATGGRPRHKFNRLEDLLAAAQG